MSFNKIILQLILVIVLFGSFSAKVEANYFQWQYYHNQSCQDDSNYLNVYYQVDVCVDGSMVTCDSSIGLATHQNWNNPNCTGTPAPVDKIPLGCDKFSNYQCTSSIETQKHTLVDFLFATDDQTCGGQPVEANILNLNECLNGLIYECNSSLNVYSITKYNDMSCKGNGHTYTFDLQPKCAPTSNSLNQITMCY